MRPLFTIHAGEYLVGERLEGNKRKPNVWVPTKDKGIDLLVTDETFSCKTSIQAKFSKDFLPTFKNSFMLEYLNCCGWWTLNAEKIKKSKADYWILVLHSFSFEKVKIRGNYQFIVIKPTKLLEKLTKIHGPNQKIFQTYLWITNKNKCIEGRNLTLNKKEIVMSKLETPKERDFTCYLDQDLESVFTGWH